MEPKIVRSLVLALCLGATRAFAQEDPSPRVELWAEPLGMVVSGVASVSSYSDVAYAPVGVTWRARPDARPWTVELAPYYTFVDEGQFRTYGARLSMGPVYGAGPGESGGFVQPLGTLLLHVNTQTAMGLGLEAGFDVGYRFQLGRVSVIPLLGLGLGVGHGLRVEGTNYAAYNTLDVAFNGKSGGTFMLYNISLDLLRVGFTY